MLSCRVGNDHNMISGYCVPYSYGIDLGRFIFFVTLALPLFLMHSEQKCSNIRNFHLASWVMLVACAYFFMEERVRAFYAFALILFLKSLFQSAQHFMSKGKNSDPHLWLRIRSWSWRSRNMRIRIPNTGRCSRLLSYSFALICWTWDVSSLDTNFKMLALAVHFSQLFCFLVQAWRLLWLPRWPPCLPASSRFKSSAAENSLTKEQRY